MKYKKHLYIAYLTVGLLLTNIAGIYAQPPGGGSGDPGTPCPADQTDCPLDTWVIIFAALVLIATCFHLYKKQKSAIVL